MFGFKYFCIFHLHLVSFPSGLTCFPNMVNIVFFWVFDHSMFGNTQELSCQTECISSSVLIDIILSEDVRDRRRWTTTRWNFCSHAVAICDWQGFIVSIQVALREWIPPARRCRAGVRKFARGLRIYFFEYVYVCVRTACCFIFASYLFVASSVYVFQYKDE